MIVALTGGTGVLGGAVLERLLAAGHGVKALARVREGRALPARRGLSWVPGSLDERASLDRLVGGTDAIVHAAYCPMDDPPPEGRSMVEHFIQTNVAGALRLIERTPATRGRELLFVSSLAVYGTQWQLDPAAGRIPVDEGFPIWPREFYGAHKAALEKMVIAAAGDTGMRTSVFRIGCVLARYPDAGRDPLAATVVEAERHGEIRTRKGAYVITAEDAAAVLVGALGDDSVAGRVINTFHRWLDFGELAPALSELLGRPVRRACEPAPEPQPPLRNDRLLARAPELDTDRRLPGLLRAALERARE